MKPFLLISTRAEDEAADNEYAAFLTYGELRPEELHRVRAEAAPLPPIDLERYSGVIVGGSPYTFSDPEERKPLVQRRVEAELQRLLDDVVARDFPFLGACYGISTLGVHQGGVVDGTYGEPVGAVPITLTDDGRGDPLLDGLPPTFQAYVGHKEALRQVPPGAVLLAHSPACPVQMFRVGQNMYATQFHPELDLPGLLTRLAVYDRHGYYPPEEQTALFGALERTSVQHPPAILRNFTARYARG